MDNSFTDDGRHLLTSDVIVFNVEGDNGLSDCLGESNDATGESHNVTAVIIPYHDEPTLILIDRKNKFVGLARNP
ncbi:MAG: hypothetical protein HRU20_30920 [Pseudomonadales bacterium]|nr:hypothetical protein [Pseudomonadales bacterium]